MATDAPKISENNINASTVCAATRKPSEVPDNITSTIGRLQGQLTIAISTNNPLRQFWLCDFSIGMG